MENAVLSLKDTVRMFVEGLFKKEAPKEIQETKEKLSIDELYKGDDPLMTAFRNAAKAFEGEAEKWGFKNEDDIVRYIKEIRKENYEKAQKEKGYA